MKLSSNRGVESRVAVVSGCYERILGTAGVWRWVSIADRREKKILTLEIQTDLTVLGCTRWLCIGPNRNLESIETNRHGSAVGRESRRYGALWATVAACLDIDDCYSV